MLGFVIGFLKLGMSALPGVQMTDSGGWGAGNQSGGFTRNR